MSVNCSHIIVHPFPHVRTHMTVSRVPVSVAISAMGWIAVILRSVRTVSTTATLMLCVQTRSVVFHARVARDTRELVSNAKTKTNVFLVLTCVIQTPCAPIVRGGTSVLAWQIISVMGGHVNLARTTPRQKEAGVPVFAIPATKGMVLLSVKNFP
eukprot:Rmarinus@m.29469